MIGRSLLEEEEGEGKRKREREREKRERGAALVDIIYRCSGQIERRIDSISEIDSINTKTLFGVNKYKYIYIYLYIHIHMIAPVWSE